MNAVFITSNYSGERLAPHCFEHRGRLRWGDYGLPRRCGQVEDDEPAHGREGEGPALRGAVGLRRKVRQGRGTAGALQGLLAVLGEKETVSRIIDL